MNRQVSNIDLSLSTRLLNTGQLNTLKIKHVEIMNVQEIIRMTDITKIPQVSGFVKGIINLRGRRIVVLNLNMIMGMESKEKNENTLSLLQISAGP